MDSVYADSESLPLLVWACSLIAALLVGYAVHHRRSAWMMPCLAVIGTVYAWYLGDILYNGMGFLSRFFTPSVIRLS